MEHHRLAASVYFHFLSHCKPASNKHTGPYIAPFLFNNELSNSQSQLVRLQVHLSQSAPRHNDLGHHLVRYRSMYKMHLLRST